MMLINEPLVLQADPISLIIGFGVASKELQTGVYQIGHFGSSHFLPAYDQYCDDLTINSYGVCDTVKQILEQCPELEGSPAKYVVTVTVIRKDEQPSWGGWRWHKWGPYIGTQERTTEYIYDEPIINEVLVYHIYMKKNSNDTI